MELFLQTQTDHTTDTIWMRHKRIPKEQEMMIRFHYLSKLLYPRYALWPKIAPLFASLSGTSTNCLYCFRLACSWTVMMPVRSAIIALCWVSISDSMQLICLGWLQFSYKYYYRLELILLSSVLWLPSCLVPRHSAGCLDNRRIMSLNYCLCIRQICKTILSVNLPATNCRNKSIVRTQIQIAYATNNENTSFIIGKGASWNVHGWERKRERKRLFVTLHEIRLWAFSGQWGICLLIAM